MTTTVPKVCGYCGKEANALVGEPDGKRAARDHPDCYRQLLENLGTAEALLLVERTAARLAALESGDLHPDDDAFIVALPWQQPPSQPHCTRCGGRHPTVVVGTPEAGSGGGTDIRYCRACVGIYLMTARFQAEDHGRIPKPALPRLG